MMISIIATMMMMMMMKKSTGGSLELGACIVYKAFGREKRGVVL